MRSHASQNDSEGFTVTTMNTSQLSVNIRLRPWDARLANFFPLARLPQSAGSVREVIQDCWAQSVSSSFVLNRGRIRNMYTPPNTAVMKKANTAKTNNSVSQSVFEDPAAENASFGVRMASTMAQMLTTIADTTSTKPTSVPITAPTG